jgi:hypothetical protein
MKMKQLKKLLMVSLVIPRRLACRVFGNPTFMSYGFVGLTIKPLTQPTRPLKLTGGLLLLCAFAVQAAENPHTISTTGNSSTCTSCHVSEIHHDKAELLNTKNKQVDSATFNNDGVAMCSGCHNAEDGHKVGLKLDFEIPADMPLNKKNALSCLTCHYTHGNLASDKPQASFSFMDRLLNADRLHKSFLLRHNNVDGELCLICHNSNQGSK